MLTFLNIKKVIKMNFIEAIKEAEKGNKVRVKIWNEDSHIKKEDDGTLIFFYGNEQSSQSTNHSHPKIVFLGLLLNSIGWEIYQEEPKLHTFEEALKALKNGAKIYRTSKPHQVHKKTDCQFFYTYEDFEANDWIIDEKMSLENPKQKPKR